MSAKIDNNYILESAVHVAERDGFLNLKRESIAEHAKVSVGKVTNAFGTMTKLKRSVMRQAINKNILSIIGEGLLLKMKCCMRIEDVDLKEKAVRAVMERQT